MVRVGWTRVRNGLDMRVEGEEDIRMVPDLGLTQLERERSIN